jgi:hypothetical protein
MSNGTSVWLSTPRHGDCANRADGEEEAQDEQARGARWGRRCAASSEQAGPRGCCGQTMCAGSRCSMPWLRRSQSFADRHVGNQSSRLGKRRLKAGISHAAPRITAGNTRTTGHVSRAASAQVAPTSSMLTERHVSPNQPTRPAAPARNVVRPHRGLSAPPMGRSHSHADRR